MHVKTPNYQSKSVQIIVEFKIYFFIKQVITIKNVSKFSKNLTK